MINLSRHIIGILAMAILAAAVQAAPPLVLLRVPKESPAPADLPGLIAQWVDSGQVAEVLLLTQGRPEKPGTPAGFQAMGVLKFSGEDAYQTWKKDTAQTLPHAWIVRRAVVLTHDEIMPRDPSRSVFVVNAYTPKVPRERYQEFASGYLAPLYAAQQATKLLLRSTMYLEEGAVGEAQALAVLEYRDQAALTDIVPLKLQIREKLTTTNPTYAKFHPIKDELRSDDGGTFANYAGIPASRR